MKGLVVVLTVVTAALSAAGEPGPVFHVEYSNPQLVPARWTMELHPDGSGHFHSERGSAPRSPDLPVEAPNIDRDIQLSPEFAKHVFHVTEHKALFRNGCESHMKVAFQGIKKLTYTGPDGNGSCEFNYSKDPEIQSLGDSLVAVANTLVEGARLQNLWRHDPLGLDREMGVLSDLAADGHVQQIGSIRDVLEGLAEDPNVMDRVRRKARALLSTVRD